jgi:hypothetical protein
LDDHAVKLIAGSRQSGSQPVAGRAAVPWRTVLPLAVVLSGADGFWAVSLRTEVGAVARAQAPFASWLRESMLALPLFVFAVLGALTLALSWLSPDLRRPRAVVTTALFVVAAATAAGLAWLVAGSAYDYHLQVQQLQTMGSMGGRCGGACLVHQRHATLMLQVKAVSYGTGVLFVTNLVLVGWMVAIRGGRLDLTTTTRRRRGGALARPITRSDLLRLVLVAALLGSAAVHAGTVLAAGPAAEILALGLTAAQLAVAVRLLGEPTRAGLVAAVVVALGALAVSVLSLRSGIPFGVDHGAGPPTGLAQGMVCLLAVVTLAAASTLLGARRWLAPPPPSAHQSWLALIGVLALTVLGLAGTGIV